MGTLGCHSWGQYGDTEVSLVGTPGTARSHSWGQAGTLSCHFAGTLRCHSWGHWGQRGVTRGDSAGTLRCHSWGHQGVTRDSIGTLGVTHGDTSLKGTPGCHPRGQVTLGDRTHVGTYQPWSDISRGDTGDVTHWDVAPMGGRVTRWGHTSHGDTSPAGDTSTVGDMSPVGDTPAMGTHQPLGTCHPWDMSPIGDTPPHDVPPMSPLTSPGCSCCP
uniref:Uncharacterized protein n=1 Tax=Cyanoderma ruficeps TaxID=181631 RepID=A0A8C3R5S3_9PASS